MGRNFVEILFDNLRLKRFGKDFIVKERRSVIKVVIFDILGYIILNM